MRSAKVSLGSPESVERGVHIQVEREVWETNGCTTFLQKLNFELSGKGRSTPWVTLSAPAARLDRKTLHFAATAIVAVFGECDLALLKTLLLQPFTTWYCYCKCISVSELCDCSFSGPEELMQLPPHNLKYKTSELL